MITTPATTMAVPAYSARQRVSQIRVVRSEWTKLWSLRSTVWSLAAAVVLIVGAGVLAAMARASNWPPRNPAAIASFDPTAVSLTGVYLAQFAIGVLGVLIITGEYSTGMIRSSLAAVPRRLPVLWGKIIAFALTTLALCVPAVIAAFLAGQQAFSGHHIGVTLSHPGSLRAVLGSALFLTAVGILGLGLGALLRNTAAAMASLFGLLLVIPIMVGFLPRGWADRVSKYLPYSAGTSITNANADPSALAPWTGLGVFCLYVVVALALAAWQLRRRDA